MTSRTESIKDFYTRKVGGERYEYVIEYSPGIHIEWNARVYQDGILKGTPTGVISDNTLTGTVLRQQLITLIECTIETALGIKE